MLLHLPLVLFEALRLRALVKVPLQALALWPGLLLRRGMRLLAGYSQGVQVQTLLLCLALVWVGCRSASELQYGRVLRVECPGGCCW